MLLFIPLSATRKTTRRGAGIFSVHCERDFPLYASLFFQSKPDETEAKREREVLKIDPVVSDLFVCRIQGPRVSRRRRRQRKRKKISITAEAKSSFSASSLNNKRSMRRKKLKDMMGRKEIISRLFNFFPSSFSPLNAQSFPSFALDVSVLLLFSAPPSSGITAFCS